MNFLKVLLVCYIALVLSACSSITGGRKIDYKSAKTRSTLEVPPDLTQLPPSRGESGATTYSGYAAEQAITNPGGSVVLPSYQKVKLQRGDGQRWLVVTEKPEKVWPQLREFVFSMGLSIARENRATGMIETDWAENRVGLSSGWFSRFISGTGLRDKYRIRIDSGSRPGITEIYLSHLGLEEVVASGGGDQIVQTVWQRRPSDLDLEAEMMRLLMIHLGVEDARARSMLVAGAGRARATLSFDDNNLPLIRLNDPFGSAWRRIGKALDRLGVEIKDRNRNKGVYLIRVSDPNSKKKKAGFFARLFGRDKKAQVPEYRVHLRAQTKGTELRLLESKKDRPVDTRDGISFIKSLSEVLR